jgi:Subtilase family
MANAAGDASQLLGPELIMVAHLDAELRVHGGRAVAGAGDIGPFNRALEETSAAPRSLFGPNELRVQARQQESPWSEPDLSVYYSVPLEPGADHSAIAERLAQEDAVAGAYVKAAPVIDVPAVNGAPESAALTDVPLLAMTPDFSARQNYLEAPPVGVNARSSWTQPGGDGTGVQVILVGGAWRLEHEDLHGDASGVIAGTPIDSLSFRNHGTAMLGVVRADRNAFGVTGVAPACTARQVATFGLGTAAAINAAANALTAGGVILCEWQRPGPGATGVGSAGFIAIEWWPDDFAAIQAATARGMIFVAPAGNGGVSLDDPRYAQPLPGFPATWANPFGRGTADSGSILVGAGSPPDQTHGRPQQVDRSRLDFSNYGTCVDAQGWGAEVTTLAYGDLQGGDDENLWYTDVFGGTSAAAAMVAGVIAALQGVNVGGGSKRAPLTPAQVRQLLRSSGSPQQDGNNPATQRIGSRPELLALIAQLPPAKDEGKDGKDGKNESKDNKDGKDPKDSKDSPDNKQNKDNKDNKDHKDTKDNKDHKDRKDDKGDKVETPKELKDFGAEKQPRAVENIAAQPMAAVAFQSAWPAENPDRVQHFILQAHRPNLAAAALLDEPDLADRDG